MPRFLDFFTHLGANHSSNVRSTLPSALQASKSSFFQSLLTSLVSLHLSSFIGSIGSESENIFPNSSGHIISFLLPFLSMALKTHLKSTSLSMPRSVAFFSQSGANHSSNVSSGYCGFFPSALQASKSSLCQSLSSTSSQSPQVILHFFFMLFFLHFFSFFFFVFFSHFLVDILSEQPIDLRIKLIS